MYSMSSSHSGASSLSANSQMLGIGVKIETDSHCFFIREQLSGVGNGEERSMLFAQKYSSRVKLTSNDLKRLRNVTFLSYVLAN